MLLRSSRKMKLSPRFYGPYRVLKRIGQVAYRLDLPSHSRLHPVFYVSQIKKKLGAADCVVEELSTATDNGTIRLEPKRLIDILWVQHGGKTIQEALVQWTGLSPEDATKEGYAELQMQFPHLNLKDKIRLEGERNVMTREAGDSNHGAMQEDMQVDMDEEISSQ